VFIPHDHGEKETSLNGISEVFSRLNMIKLLEAESKGCSLNGETDEPLNLAWDQIRWASTQNSAISSMLWRWIRTTSMVKKDVTYAMLWGML
jgi:hypothetical protein